LIIWVNQREKNTSLADYHRIKLAEERRNASAEISVFKSG